MSTFDAAHLGVLSPSELEEMQLEAGVLIPEKGPISGFIWLVRIGRVIVADKSET